jgi:hypothetical protein
VEYDMSLCTRLRLWLVQKEIPREMTEEEREKNDFYFRMFMQL